MVRMLGSCDEEQAISVLASSLSTYDTPREEARGTGSSRYGGALVPSSLLWGIETVPDGILVLIFTIVYVVEEFEWIRVTALI